MSSLGVRTGSLGTLESHVDYGVQDRPTIFVANCEPMRLEVFKMKRDRLLGTLGSLIDGPAVGNAAGQRRDKNGVAALVFGDQRDLVRVDLFLHERGKIAFLPV